MYVSPFSFPEPFGESKAVRKLKTFIQIRAPNRNFRARQSQSCVVVCELFGESGQNVGRRGRGTEKLFRLASKRMIQ